MTDILRLVLLMRPYWRWMVASILLSVVVILSNVALLALSGWFITAMALAGLGLMTLEFFTAAALIRGLAILRTLARYLDRLISHDATLRMISHLRVWFYDRLAPLAPARLQGLRHGDVLATIRADTDSLETFFLRVLSPVIAGGISTVIVTVFIAAYAPGVAAMNLGVLVVSGVLIPLCVGMISVASGADLTRRRAVMQTELTDLSQGFSELYLMGAISQKTTQILAASRAYISAQRRLTWVGAAGNAASGLAGQIGVWAALMLLLPVASQGTLSGPHFAMLAFAVMASGEAVAGLPAAFAALATTKAAAARLFAIADQTPVFTPVDDPTPAFAPVPASVTGAAIRFDHVAMAYDDGAEVFDDLSFTLAAGQKLAITGPSGCGKTTVLSLLQRFWLPVAGRIDLAGVPINQIAESELRDLITVVDQRGYLFNGTIRDNLLLARPDADEADLIWAMEQVSMTQDLAKFPKGLDSFVGEGGVFLSGGQARRLCVARAFLRHAPIVLLDEPTENLDAENESIVLGSLAVLLQDRTAIIVTHRPQLLQLADHRLDMTPARIGTTA